MLFRLIQIFQGLLLWSIVRRIHARYRPHPVMTMYANEIRFFPRQNYCLRLLEVIEDTGGYYGAHVICQRNLCRHFRGQGKICATNGEMRRTFQNQCVLCAKGCEELNMRRKMFRYEHSGTCRDKGPFLTTTDVISTFKTSVRVTPSPRLTRLSTLPSVTEHTTKLLDTTSFGMTSTSDDGETSSFTIVVDGSTVVVSTAQPFTSPFTSKTTPALSYLPVDDLTTFETLRLPSSTQSLTTASTSDGVTAASMSTVDEATTKLDTDIVSTSPTEILTSPSLPISDTATTFLYFTSNNFIRRTDITENTLSSSTEELESRGPKELQNMCNSTEPEFKGSKLKYQVNNSPEKQLCVRNDANAFKFEATSLCEISQKLSAVLPVLPPFKKGR